MRQFHGSSSFCVILYYFLTQCALKFSYTTESTFFVKGVDTPTNYGGHIYGCWCKWKGLASLNHEDSVSKFMEIKKTTLGEFPTARDLTRFEQN